MNLHRIPKILFTQAKFYSVPRIYLYYSEKFDSELTFAKLVLTWQISRQVPPDL